MDPSDGKELFREARRLYQKKEYADALSRFHAINEAFPGNPDILTPLARCLIKLERLDEAREVHASLIKMGASDADQIAERLVAAGGTPATPPPPDEEPPSAASDTGSPVFDVAFDSEDHEEATPSGADEGPPTGPADDDTGPVPMPDFGEERDSEPDASPRTAERAATTRGRRLGAGRGALRAAGTVFLAQGGVTAFYALLGLAVLGVARRYAPMPPLAFVLPVAMLAFAALNFVAAAGVANGRRAFARFLAVVSLVFIPAGTVCGVTVLINLAQRQSPSEATGLS